MVHFTALPDLELEPARYGRPPNSNVGPLHANCIAESNRTCVLECFVTYLLGIGGVLLLQIGFSFAIILAASGGGSFVGLGAMLLAVLGIPLTALVNLLLIRANRRNPASPYVLRLALVSLALPAAQLTLMILVSVLRL